MIILFWTFSFTQERGNFAYLNRLENTTRRTGALFYAQFYVGNAN